MGTPPNPQTPPEVSPQSVEELRQHKAYVKLLKQQYRELKELRKKHVKKLVALHKRLAARWDPKIWHPKTHTTPPAPQNFPWGPPQNIKPHRFKACPGS